MTERPLGGEATPPQELLEVVAAFVLGGWSKVVSPSAPEELLRVIVEGQQHSPIGEVVVRPYLLPERRAESARQHAAYDEAIGGLPVEPTPQEWRDISTAPKDGTRILVWRASRVRLMHWKALAGHKDGGHWDEWGLRLKELAAQPTHWMPLPPAPGPVSSQEETAQRKT